MVFGDILYIIAMFLFAFITFGIVKNYSRMISYILKAAR
jgi:hypothetical protein